MTYLVLRNCFTSGRYFAKGTICDLPDSIEKSPKNFQAVGSEDIQGILVDSPKWVNPPPEPVEAMPAPSSEPTGDAAEERPLYVSDKPPKSKKKRRKAR